MKKLFIIFGILIIAGCDKSIIEPFYPSFTPTNIDENAGNWKTYIIQKPNEIEVSSPDNTSSKNYNNELDSLKKATSLISFEDKKNIVYWSSGSVFRWNEIARTLAAKYNYTPKVNDDGSYAQPNPLKPNDYPKYPIANPPYTARALAYLSVAQYDALVSTWHYKFKFNRPTPYAIDASIKPSLQKSKIPTYPSEDAAVAGSSYQVLLKMFPGEEPYLKQQLENCTKHRILAGMNVKSDMVAGEKLGKAIAAKVLAVAALDGMADANKQTILTELKANASKIGIKQQWESKEIPARPPLLPNYGAVKTWNMDKAKMISIRPALPYLPSSDKWSKELEELKNLEGKLTKEQIRIANYWSDGTFTYTPPGHWHRIASVDAQAAKFSEVRMARALALLGTALMDAGIACWETKYYYMMPRPQQYGVKTPIGLPNFPSFTSGHSTFSAAAATVMAGIFPSESKKYASIAKESSESRIYGLIHFRSDCEIGITHGNKIGAFALIRAEADNSGLTVK